LGLSAIARCRDELSFVSRMSTLTSLNCDLYRVDPEALEALAPLQQLTEVIPRLLI
jgi:hypothetical protein